MVYLGFLSLWVLFLGRPGWPVRAYRVTVEYQTLGVLSSASQSGQVRYRNSYQKNVRVLCAQVFRNPYEVPGY